MQQLALRQSPHPGPKAPAAAGLAAGAFAEKAGEHLHLPALDCVMGGEGRNKDNIHEGSCFFFHL